MPAAFVDEWRTVHVVVLNRRNEVDANEAAARELPPSEQRLRAARKQMDAELGIRRR